MRVYKAKVETPAGDRHIIGVRAKTDRGTERARAALTNVSNEAVRFGKWAVARVEEDTPPEALNIYLQMGGDTLDSAGEVVLNAEDLQMYLGEQSTSKVLGLHLESVA